MVRNRHRGATCEQVAWRRTADENGKTFTLLGPPSSVSVILLLLPKGVPTFFFYLLFPYLLENFILAFSLLRKWTIGDSDTITNRQLDLKKHQRDPLQRPFSTAYHKHKRSDTDSLPYKFPEAAYKTFSPWILLPTLPGPELFSRRVTCTPSRIRSTTEFEAREAFKRNTYYESKNTT